MAVSPSAKAPTEPLGERHTMSMSPPRSPLAGGDEKSPLAAAMAPQPQPRPRPQPQSPVPPQQTQRISWMPMSPPRKSLLLSPLTKSPGVRRRSFSPRLRHEAAMKIQAMWRAYDTRQRMAHMVETLIRWIEEWRQKAAVQMQRIVRGFLSRANECRIGYYDSTGREQTSITK